MTNEMTTSTDLLLNTEVMNSMQHMATLMSGGISTVPKHLQNSPADCLAVIMQAAQWRMNPYAVAQKTHLVNGHLGYEAQLVNAVISSSKAIAGRFHYEYQNQGKADLAVRVGAVLAGDTDITWGQWIYLKAQTTKNSPLWKTDPAQQLAYLAVKKWSRLYTPDVILGVYTPDELEEIDRPVKDVTSKSEVLQELMQKDAVQAEKTTKPVEEAVIIEGEEVPQQTVDEFNPAGVCDTAVFKMEAAESEAELRDVFGEAYKALSGHNTWQGTLKSVYDEQKKRFE